jgi:hypothetical protein
VEEVDADGPSHNILASTMLNDCSLQVHSGRVEKASVGVGAASGGIDRRKLAS